ncbi:MAG TPA: DNA-3-methyladenine glycosylase 2 [Longimicrobiales bacterium]|nr:DNA-3-methyladenine glycosylase 2 [Longimicrobiales bacterium]
MEQDARYTALSSRDRRFDGVFFVGVSSTGIYCRPVCRARRPQARNCTFFRTAAEAEGSGYRPCLKCRPELAPGRSLTDASDRLARAAYERIAAGALDEHSVRDVARDLCVGERHLRRVVGAEFGASPVELAQTQRLLLAKQLLTETDLPVSRVAFASGFSSLSRFNTLFRSRYRLSPTGMRRTRRNGVHVPGSLSLLFEYRPPYDWQWLLGFLATRAIPGIEFVQGGSYMRSLRVGAHTGWFSVCASRGHETALEVEISDSLVPALLPVRAAVRRMFDLDADPAALVDHFASDGIMGPLVRGRPGLRLPGAVDGFELAVRGVLGQQISVAAARTLAGRLHAAYGDAVAGAPGIDRLPASPSRLAEADPDDISRLGMPLSRARTVVLLAQSVTSGDISFAPTADIASAIESLQRVPGIGPWTAEYIAMRGYQWPDAFPATDLGIRTALRGQDPARVSEAWRPWRAYAAIHLWNSLSANGNG